MLQHLRIRNLALVESAELAFGPGFTVVTGETGAGKSVLLGALGLLAGERADKGLIRHGADACEVEGALWLAEPAAVDEVLAAHGLPPCEDGQLLLRRGFARVGKPPRITVNGALATASALQALGERWIDFHGPGAPQRLFTDAAQLALVDLHGRTGPLLAAHRLAYGVWRATVAEIEEIRAADKLSPDEIEFLRAQVEKIDRSLPDDEALAALERDFARLAKAQDLMGAALALEDALAGGQGVTARLAKAVGQARQLATLDPGADALRARLESLVVEAGDLAEDYAALARECDFEPATAARLEKRMAGWLDLKRQYGGDPAAIRARRAALAEKLALQGDVEGRLIVLEHRAEKELAAARAAAAALSRARAAAVPGLIAEASGRLRRLGFKQAALELRLEPERELTAHGAERAVLHFSANPGTPLQPLAKIASSGEMARVMLALKATVARADATPVLVFDEVDANVGGEIAVALGKELAALGEAHQVFCVTHLPQVAALAPQHWLVRKEQSAEATAVHIEPLHGDRPGRVGELARMLGDRASPAALRHAAELLPGEESPPPMAADGRR